MNPETTPGYVSLVALLESTCYTRANFVVFSDNFVEKFYARKSEKGVLFCGMENKFPSMITDGDIKSRLLENLLNLPYVLIYVESLTPKIDETSCKQIIEYRGYEVEYKNGQIVSRQLPREDVLLRNIDPTTGQVVDPDTNEIYF